MEEYFFDFLAGILMVFFAYVGFNSLMESATLMDSIAAICGLCLSGIFGFILMSKFGKQPEDIKELVTQQVSKNAKKSKRVSK